MWEAIVSLNKPPAGATPTDRRRARPEHASPSRDTTLLGPFTVEPARAFSREHVPVEHPSLAVMTTIGRFSEAALRVYLDSQRKTNSSSWAS